MVGRRWRVGLGLSSTVFARFELDVIATPLIATAAAVALTVVLHTGIGYQQFIYRGRYGFGTLDEVRAIFLTVLAIVATLFTVDALIPDQPLPLSTPLLGGLLALISYSAGATCAACCKL